MKWSIFSLLLISFSATLISDLPSGRYFVVWNVGQGLWTTEINQGCQHFDMGGEFFPLRKIKRWCGDRKNQIYLSHWDLDHVGGLKYRRQLGSETCLALRPLGKSSRRKENLLKDLPTCSQDPSLQIFSGFETIRESNDRSHVILNDEILLPGDSTITMEKIWSSKLRGVQKTRLLLLGHHGSKTSTSKDLLVHMPILKMAVASARWKRYRHPHFLVEARLKQHRIPLLRTEDWGNLWFQK